MKPLENLLHFAPLLITLAWAALGDLRTRRISNLLTLALGVSGVVASFLAGGVLTPWQSLLGVMVGLALPLPSFALEAMGAGDVKLLMAVGAWVGPRGVVVVYLAAAVIGMVIVLVQSALQGRLVALFRNSAVVAINLAHLRRLGADNAKAVGQSCRSIDEPLPYAVPVLAGVLVLLAVPVLWG